MSKLKNFLKKAGNTLGDVGKAVAKTIVAPVNAITGHEYNPNMKTKFGNALEKGVDFTEDVIGAAGNTATLGLAKKVGIFDGERETKAGVIVGSAVGAAVLVAGVAAAGSAIAGGSAAGGAGSGGVLTKIGAGGLAKSIIPQKPSVGVINTDALNDKPMTSHTLEDIKDSLSVAGFANVRSPDFSDLTKSLVVSEVTQKQGGNGKFLEASKGILGLLGPKGQTKAQGILGTVNSIFGNRATNSNGVMAAETLQGSTPSINPIYWIIGGIILLVLLFKR